MPKNTPEQTIESKLKTLEVLIKKLAADIKDGKVNHQSKTLRVITCQNILTDVENLKRAKLNNPDFMQDKIASLTESLTELETTKVPETIQKSVIQ